MTHPTATGRRDQRDGTTYVEFRREFRAPITDVWASVTEPARLERWIGTWSGDPASGSIEFRMTAEGEDAPAETHRIVACDPPRHLVTESTGAGEETVWRLELDLAEAGGVTVLTFAQRLEEAIQVESVGPGWDYYLDRLVVAHDGRDVAGVVWDDYYPALADHYRAEFG
ncbi:SRPBCC family protein [Nocardioides sp. GXQ0305]|uniref:SRPBCC family protein n=1 Tax=Nocardioides sp. GXQ0305 TaxID=3423912 RepID=UPI003D7EA6D8